MVSIDILICAYYMNTLDMSCFPRSCLGCDTGYITIPELGEILPQYPGKCENILPSKLTEELQTVLPVLGFYVLQTTDKTEQPGSIQLIGVDRLQLLVISAATDEAT